MTVPASEVALSGLTLLRIVNSLVALECPVEAVEIDVQSSTVSASDALEATSFATSSTTWTTSASVAAQYGVITGSAWTTGSTVAIARSLDVQSSTFTCSTAALVSAESLTIRSGSILKASDTTSGDLRVSVSLSMDLSGAVTAGSISITAPLLAVSSTGTITGNQNVACAGHVLLFSGALLD